MLRLKTEDILNLARLRTAAVRDRIVSGLAGRSRHVVAVATLAGVATVGLVAANLDNTTPNSSNTAASVIARDQAADRADRSARDSKTATPQESPASPEAQETSTPAQPAQTQAAPAAAPAPAWVIPMPGAEVTSCYGQRWGVLHAGIDFAMPENTDIHAAAAGTVVAAGWVYSGYGISVVVDHGDGILTHYAHMNKEAVTVGQHVEPGQLIGYEGSTGDSTGPHLHFEVHAGMWNQIDPAPFLRDHGVQVGC